MTRREVFVSVVVLALLGAGSYAGYRLGMTRGMIMSGADGTAHSTASAPATSADAAGQTVPQGESATRRHVKDGIKAGDLDPVTGRRVLYYQDPMVPGKRFENPGKSPFMDMMLVPVYAGSEGSDSGQVTISARIQQNLGMRTAEVVEGTLSPEVSAIGSISWNERDQVVVQARATGYVERLHARAAFDPVGKGKPLAELYVPDWVAAQEEFLAVRRMRGNDLQSLVDAARARMRQAGMDEFLIAQIEASGIVQARISVLAPISGVLTEVMAREGMTAMAGATLFRIQGTGTVWAHAELPESQIPLVRPGTRVQARSTAIPGETFEGRIQSLLPEVNPATRTLKARLEIVNRGGKLAPGMLMQMRFTDLRADKSVLVPTEAIIHTGERAVVMLAEDDGRFRPVTIEPGLESGDQTEVRSGLKAGQRVVVSSQFLIDSEARLKGVEARLNAPSASTAPKSHSAQALVEAVQDDTVTLTHPPIASLRWPAMTMDFKLPPAAQRPRTLARGDRVEIEFQAPDGDVPQITRIQRREAQAGVPGSKP